LARKNTIHRFALLAAAGLIAVAVAPFVFRMYYATASEPALAPPAVMAQPAELPPAPPVRRASRPTRARYAPPAAVSTKGFAWPVIGSHAVTSPFGPRDDGFHHGADIACGVGQSIYAMRSGVVRYAAEARAYGLVVLLDHGSGYQTVYAHLDRLDVTVGQRVGSRQQLGTCGETGNATGPHLHLEMRVGRYVYDPLQFLP
jgi:murein DD-endopeptidase MepM/ murein hydrolase activator NlpD